MEGLLKGGKVKTSRDNNTILAYIGWILSECDNPVDEIEWLIFQCNDDAYQEILDWKVEYNKTK